MPFLFHLMPGLCSQWHQWHCIPQFSSWTMISTFSLKHRTKSLSMTPFQTRLVKIRPKAQLLTVLQGLDRVRYWCLEPALTEADSSQVRPSQARTKLETATKQTLSPGSLPVSDLSPPPSLPPAATHKLVWALFRLFTLYLTLDRSHTSCTLKYFALQ